MFGKKTESSISNVAPAKTQSSLTHNSLVHGTNIEGDVRSNTDFRLDGSFTGNLTCQARVIIGPTGVFNGIINCKNAIIEGKFNGTLRIEEILEVKEGASIEGDVSTNKLVVHSGSVFDVNCTMGEKQDYTSPEIIEEITVESNGVVEI